MTKIARGCGNAAPMEITERFPQELGISQRTRDSHIPTSRFLFIVTEKNVE